MRRLMHVLASAGLATIAVVAGASAQGSDKAPKRGGILNFAVVAEPPNYDCHASTTFGGLHPMVRTHPLCSNTPAKDYGKEQAPRTPTRRPRQTGWPFPSSCAKREVSRWFAHDVGRRESLLRSHHQSAGGRGVRRAAPSTRTSPVEAPDRHTVVFGSRPPTPPRWMVRLALELHLQRSEAEGESRYPETKIMGTGAFTFVEHVKGPELGGQALRRLLQAGPTLH